MKDLFCSRLDRLLSEGFGYWMRSSVDQRQQLRAFVEEVGINIDQACVFFAARAYWLDFQTESTFTLNF